MKKVIDKDVKQALIRTIKEAENNGHRTILFPVPDAKILVKSINEGYTIGDLKKAFEDGILYDANELELDTAGRYSAFECWFEQIFNKQ